jgi:hypothetical protein
LGLSAPDLSPTANSISISELFRWLRACVAMVTSGSRAMGDLSAAVAVRSLSAAICKFIPAEGGVEAAVTKAQLRSMCDLSFAWPSPDEVHPEALSPLPKNIAKSFTATSVGTSFMPKRNDFGSRCFAVIVFSFFFVSKADF